MLSQAALYSEPPKFISLQVKKGLFFDKLRYEVRLENNRILEERALLQGVEVNLQLNQVTAGQKIFIAQMAKAYRFALPKRGVTQSWLDEMFLRVNILPEALVLSQSANESAWGRSRFAKLANNYFGQWCYSKGCGIVPLKRDTGATHELARFKTVRASVHAYFMNVNRNRAYRSLREIRARLVKKQQDLTTPKAALLLAIGLKSYSELGQQYVNTIESIIQDNRAFWQPE